MATDRTLLAFLALLLMACGGSADPAAVDPATSVEDAAPADPTPPTAAPRPLPTRVLADVDTVITREVFSYRGGARDPFASLIGTDASGPAVSDLDLAAIYYVAGNAGLTTAVVREKVSGRRYSVRVGQRIGRLYVASITEQDLWFTIDDFGVQRRESLTLRKQEDDIR